MQKQAIPDPQMMDIMRLGLTRAEAAGQAFSPKILKAMRDHLAGVIKGYRQSKRAVQKPTTQLSSLLRQKSPELLKPIPDSTSLQDWSKVSTDW